jgi:hypothetical protein
LPPESEGMVARNGITVTKNGDECSSDEKKVRVNLKILFLDEKENFGRVESYGYKKFEKSSKKTHIIFINLFDAIYDGDLLHNW